MTGYPEPNYTQVPNALLDIDMRDMSEAELKVTLGIVRHYIGYHKTKPEPISYSQLEEITGMKRQGVANGVKAALARGRIALAPEKGPRGASLYTVNFADQSTKQTSSSPPSRPELVHEVDTQKKGKENSKEKSIAPKAQRKPDPLFDALAEYIFDAPPDSPAVGAVGGRVGKIKRWCLGGELVRGKGSAKEVLPGCTMEVTPDHIRRWAADYRSQHHNASLPRDPWRFAEHFAPWLYKSSNATRPAKHTTDAQSIRAALTGGAS